MTDTLASVQAPRKTGSRTLACLVAEDDPVQRRLVVRLIAERGHHVVATNNGREALAALEGAAFDVLLTDIRMPLMDGVDTVAAVRRREKETGTHLPIIAMTAYDPDDEARCLAAGIECYLRKPIAATDLIGMIEHLGGRRG